MYIWRVLATEGKQVQRHEGEKGLGDLEPRREQLSWERDPCVPAQALNGPGDERPSRRPDLRES